MKNANTIRGPGLVLFALVLSAGCDGAVAEEVAVLTGELPVGSEQTLNVLSEIPTRIVPNANPFISYRLDAVVTAATRDEAREIRRSLDVILERSSDAFDIRTVRGTGSLGSASGELLIRVPETMDLEITQLVGPATLVEPAQNVSLQIDIGDGEITSNAPAGTTVVANADSGNIRVLLPRNPSVLVRLNAAKEVLVTHPDFLQPDINTGFYEATLNGGEATIELMSFGTVDDSNGFIFLDLQPAS